MKKKIPSFLFASALIVTAGYFFFSLPESPYYQTSYCPFCDPKVLNAQTFYEGEKILALYTHRPLFPGHCLVIPKRHIERFEKLTDEEALEMTQVLKKVHTAAAAVFDIGPYLLWQKNGQEVGQSVPHIHFHYIPRKIGDDSMLKFIYRMFMANHDKALQPDEMRAIVTKMRAAM